ncbi:hypothetical protein AAVH_19975 [Aphelenchoides avenae]|nr:hypothetical protein AAVH_19975 [Aphelenchus avenae]
MALTSTNRNVTLRGITYKSLYELLDKSDDLLKKTSPTTQHMLKDYISEFMWRQKHAGPDVFYHLWEMAAKVYPVESHTPTQSEFDEVGGEQEIDGNVEKMNRLSLDRVFIEDF